ncbi:hypothetical protein [Geodermatophilus sp. CPCC 206100]|uniref:hypothetical protein n=1 Tax=Geodermatophilus sp. CPCC 206100 TaxID=3020054 RepID=UPI003B007114
MLFEGDRPEVVVDGAQDPGQPAAALRTGSVVDHVHGDELVEEGVVACHLASEPLLDDRPRASFPHAGKRRIATARVRGRRFSAPAPAAAHSMEVQGSAAHSPATRRPARCRLRAASPLCDRPADRDPLGRR